MSKRVYVIHLTLLLSLVLAISPMPALISNYRPDWPLLALIYWCIATPQRVNVGTGWVMGLLYDLLLGSILGTHGLIFSLIAYIASSNFLRIRNFSLWQQSIIVAMLAALYHLIQFWLSYFLKDSFFQPSLMWSAVTSMLMWPWAFLLLRKLRRKLKIK